MAQDLEAYGHFIEAWFPLNNGDESVHISIMVNDDSIELKIEL
jgi:hypothetical protein